MPKNNISEHTQRSYNFMFRSFSNFYRERGGRTENDQIYFKGDSSDSKMKEAFERGEVQARDHWGLSWENRNTKGLIQEICHDLVTVTQTRPSLTQHLPLSLLVSSPTLPALYFTLQLCQHSQSSSQVSLQSLACFACAVCSAKRILPSPG